MALSPQCGRGASLLATIVLISYLCTAGAFSHATRGCAFAVSRSAPSFMGSLDLVPRRSSSTLGSPPRALLESRVRTHQQGQSVLRMSGAGSSSVLHQGLQELADKYDAFLVDQWGVMHDGTNAYEGAVECMKELTGMGKKVVLLSNSSRRRGNSMAKLETMGFESKMIIDVVTSGETAWQGLTAEKKYAPFDELEGNKCFVFGNGDEDVAFVEACGLEFAEIEEADFILARGMFTMHDSEDVLKRSGDNAFEMWDAEALRVLQIGASRLVPMLVTNPDLVRPDGNDSPMPGQLGAMYESILSSALFGGRLVFYVGKPHALVYDKAFTLLKQANGGVDVSKERVCAVGDSLHHDIEGALRYGIDSILIADGVHAAALGLTQGKMGQPVDVGAIDKLRDEIFTRPPKYVLPHFQWAKP